MKNIFYFSFFLLLLISCNEKKKYRFGRNGDKSDKTQITNSDKSGSSVYYFKDETISIPSTGQTEPITKDIKVSNFKLENGFKITKDQGYISKEENFFVIFSFEITNVGSEPIIGYSFEEVVEEGVGGIKSLFIFDKINHKDDVHEFISRTSRVKTHIFNENNEEVFFSEKSPFLVGKKYKCFGTLCLTPDDGGEGGKLDVNWLTKIRKSDYFEPEILLYIEHSGTKTNTKKYINSFIDNSNMKITNLIEFVKKIDSDPNTINLKYKYDYGDKLLNNPWNDKMKKNKNKWNIYDFDYGFEVVRVMYDLGKKLEK